MAQSVKPVTFTGESKNENFQEALEHALSEARKSMGVGLHTWTLISTSGRIGGVVGERFLSVTIEV